MDIAITKMSSKGQVVIPVGMRMGISEGEKLVVINGNGQIILQRMKKISKRLEEDLEFAKKTEKAWKRYDRGEFVRVGMDDFLKELEKC
ncbi:MAG: AbrB/MazE/SpoVT family DNA-binding domain-containing protein [Nanoarchaeota archaeon]|nr:AbrB/MazE/SpoVT family DNA-binding domain-containing protein [Nanoarchaeota archaeon]